MAARKPRKLASEASRERAYRIDAALNRVLEGIESENYRPPEVRKLLEAISSSAYRALLDERKPYPSASAPVQQAATALPPATQTIASAYVPKDDAEKKLLAYIEKARLKRGAGRIILPTEEIMKIFSAYRESGGKNLRGIRDKTGHSYGVVWKYSKIFDSLGLKPKEDIGPAEVKEKIKADAQKLRKGWINFNRAGIHLNPDDEKQLKIAFGVCGLKMGLSEADLLKAGIIDSSALEGLARVFSEVSPKYKDARGLSAAITYSTAKARAVLEKLREIRKSKGKGQADTLKKKEEAAPIDFSDWLNFNKAGLHLDPRDPKHRALARGLYALAKGLGAQKILESGLIYEAVLNEAQRRYGALSSLYDRKSIARIISTFANNGPPKGAKTEFFEGARYLKAELEKIRDLESPPKQPREKTKKVKEPKKETAFPIPRLGLELDLADPKGRESVAALFAYLNGFGDEEIVRQGWASEDVLRTLGPNVQKFKENYSLHTFTTSLNYRTGKSPETKKLIESIRSARKKRESYVSKLGPLKIDLSKAGERESLAALYALLDGRASDEIVESGLSKEAVDQAIVNRDVLRAKWTRYQIKCGISTIATRSSPELRELLDKIRKIGKKKSPQTEEKTEPKVEAPRVEAEVQAAAAPVAKESKEKVGPLGSPGYTEKGAELLGSLFGDGGTGAETHSADMPISESHIAHLTGLGSGPIAPEEFFKGEVSEVRDVASGEVQSVAEVKGVEVPTEITTRPTPRHRVTKTGLEFRLGGRDNGRLHIPAEKLEFFAAAVLGSPDKVLKGTYGVSGEDLKEFKYRALHELEQAGLTREQLLEAIAEARETLRPEKPAERPVPSAAEKMVGAELRLFLPDAVRYVKVSTSSTGQRLHKDLLVAAALIAGVPKEEIVEAIGSDNFERDPSWEVRDAIKWLTEARVLRQTGDGNVALTRDALAIAKWLDGCKYDSVKRLLENLEIWTGEPFSTRVMKLKNTLL